MILPNIRETDRASLQKLSPTTVSFSPISQIQISSAAVIWIEQIDKWTVLMEVLHHAMVTSSLWCLMRRNNRVTPHCLFRNSNIRTMIKSQDVKRISDYHMEIHLIIFLQNPPHIPLYLHPYPSISRPILLHIYTHIPLYLYPYPSISIPYSLHIYAQITPHPPNKILYGPRQESNLRPTAYNSTAYFPSPVSLHHLQGYLQYIQTYMPIL